MTSRAFFAFAIFSAVALAPGPVAAGEPAPAPSATVSKNKVKVELVADVTAVAPGETFRLGVFLRPDPEWHVYWKFAGDTGLPTEVRWSAFDGLDFDAVAWPLPRRIPDKLGGRSFGYDNEVLLVSEVRVPDDLLEGTEVPLEAKVEWLVCKENCIQGSARVGLRLPVRTGPKAERASSQAAAFDTWAARVPAKTPPQGLSMKAVVASAPIAPGDPLAITLTFIADVPLTVREPLIESFFPATDGLEITSVKRAVAPSAADTDALSPGTDPQQLVLELAGKASLEGALASRLEGVVQLVRDGQPVTFDVHIDVPRKAGVPMPTPAEATAPLMPPTDASRSAWRAPGGADPCIEADTGDAHEGPLTSFALALVFAFLGGLILNAMPCVLPVLSLKILGIVEQAKDTPKVIWRHGLWYTLGVLVSFLVFAIIIIALQQPSWAFQFKDPTFVGVFTAIVFAFGLSLFGVFEIALPGAHHLDAKVASSHGYASSFNYGIFAVLLGTPCTAPFLGPALTFAFTQPPFEMTLLLLAVGLGLASPFLVLARFPRWRRFLPKPGPWLLTFKKVMGFFLIGTAVFMLSIFAAQVSRDALVSYLVFLAVLSFALWLYGHFSDPTRGRTARVLGPLAAAAVAVAAAMLFVSVEPAPPGPDTEVISGVTWHNFDTLDVEQRAAQGDLVFIDFTADWCTTCKVNEATAIHTEATRDLFEKLGVVAVKGDFTTHSDKIAAWLERFEEPSVPLYVVIPAGRPAEAFKLATLLSQSDVRDGLCRARRLVTAASL